jgi:hypothetical protein
MADENNMMGPLVGVAIGALILIAVFMFGPMVGGTIEDAMPDMSPDSNWNSSVNTDLPDGAETWTTIAGLLVLCAIIVVITIAFMYLKGMM